VGLDGSYRSRHLNCFFCGVLHLHDCMGWDMVNALSIDAFFGVFTGSIHSGQED
jgi:hypothetical protein